MQESNYYTQLIVGYLVWFIIFFLPGILLTLPAVFLYRHRCSKAKENSRKKDDMIFKLIVFALDQQFSNSGPPIELDDYSHSNGVTSVRIKVSALNMEQAEKYLPQYNRSLREIQELTAMKYPMRASLILEEDMEESGIYATNRKV